MSQSSPPDKQGERLVVAVNEDKGQQNDPRTPRTNKVLAEFRPGSLDFAWALVDLCREMELKMRAPSSTAATPPAVTAKEWAHLVGVAREEGFRAGKLAASATARREDGTPLLYNVHSMWLQETQDVEWQLQWKEVLAAIDQHLTRNNYPNAAPSILPSCNDIRGQQR